MTGVPAANSGTYCALAVPLAAGSELDGVDDADEPEVVEVVAEAGALAVTAVVAVLAFVPL